MSEAVRQAIADLTPEQRELLALRLRKAQPSNGGGSVVRRADARLPLSFTQEQLWFLDRLEPGTPVYNVPFALELAGPLEIDALRDAVDAVVARHEPLRTAFSEDERGARQVVMPELRLPLPVVDLRSVPKDARQEAAQRVSAEHAACSFDLTTGPLLAVRLVVLDDEEHLLLVTAHHIVFDAWSAGIFTTELVALYEQFATGQPAALPQLTVQFAEHALRTRDEAGVAAMESHLAHWSGRLAGAPLLSTLPPDRRRPPVQTHRGRRRPFALSRTLTAQLGELARSAGVTVNAVVLAGLAAVLRRATGQDDIVLGMPAASRSRTELEPLIGCFANMLVLRVDLSGDPTVRELVTRTHATVSDAYAHQDAPYARVVEEVSPPRDPSFNPLFQVMLTMADDRDEQLSAAGVTFTPASVDNGLTDFDIFITLTRRGEEVEGVVDYNADLYLDETIEQTLAQLPAVLADLAGNPHAPIESVASLGRGTVALAATFTADLVRSPLDFWLRFLRMPAGVEPVAYGQLIPHLLAGEGQAASVCLLRWEDTLRYRDADESPAEAAPVLAAAMRDLEAAARAYRQRCTAPLIFVLCPPSPRFQGTPWTQLFARLDDSLALLQARVANVHVVWAAEEAGRYPVTETFDVRADELGHVPYTAEYSAALATMAARELWRTSGQPARVVLLDERLPWRDELVQLAPQHEVVACPAGELVERLHALTAEGEGSPASWVVLDPDPATVETVRRSHPDVAAIVVPAAWEEARRLLAHLWVLERPAGEDTELFTALGPERAAYLAEHLVAPAAVLERVESLTPTPADDHIVVAPRTRTEERLAGLWCEALRLDEVGVTSDFFALGGHSLLATQLLSRVQAELGAEISLYTLFTHPTIEQLAAVLDEQGAPTVEPLLPAPRGAELVASSSQERLWALAQLDDDTARHNTNFAAVLRGSLDEGSLRHAVAEAVRRHEALRTTFAERRGRPVPVVHDELDCWLEPVDLSEVPGSERRGAIRKHIEAHTGRAYDLANGPLLAVRLLRLSPEEHYVLIGMHHIVCDNTSWSIFLDELVELYDAFAAGKPSPLPPPTLGFTDFAYHQQDWLESDAVQPHVAHWREQLSDVPALELKTDHPRPEILSDVAGHHAGPLPAGLGASVRELARAEGVAPFAVLLTAFGLLVRQESGQSDVVVGVPTAGRERPELERVIGCFTDLLPFRLDLTGRPSFRQLLRRVHATALDAYRHQSLPFARIVEALKLPRDPSRHPLFQCVFNLIDATDDLPRFSGLDVAPVEVGAPGVDFDLFLTLSWQDDDLHADLAYSADLFTPERAVTLLAGLSRVLSAALAEPDAPIVPARALPVASAKAIRERTPTQPVAIASSFPADRVEATLRFWSGLLRPELSVATAAAGQVLRPLLDDAGPFGADGRGLNVVLLRWEDWLPDVPAMTPHGLASSVNGLERALFDLCDAVQSFRRRSEAPLLVVVAPASPRFSARQWGGVAATATERLRRFCRRFGDVEVLSLEPWARRYALAEESATDGDVGISADLSAVAGTVIARRAYRRWLPQVSSVFLDPEALSAPAAVAALAREQLRYGRQVVLTAPPASPELEALLATGAVRLSAGEPVAQLGELDPSSCLILSPDAETADALRATHPEALVIVAEPGEKEPARFLGRLWLLDPPAALPSEPAGCDPPLDLLVELAAELADGDAVWSAVESGYRRVSQRRSAAPRTERERVLASIWADLLRLKEVGVHDDFFELGGDSLLAMRVVFAAAEAGITLTPRQLVRTPTIAELCAAEGPTTDDAAPCATVACAVDESDATGDLPLTPAQEWFFETLAPSMARPAHFNHPYYLELQRPVAVEHLEKAVAFLAAHHDTLRLRFLRGDDGTWRQRHASPAAAVPFVRHDLSDVGAEELERAVEALASEAQVSLDLADGPTLRVLHFRLGDGRPDRLLFVAHHLVVDAVSRGILLEDLRTLCVQLERGEPPRLPVRTTLYRTWALQLLDEAASEESRAELPFWLEQSDGGGDLLPPDDPEAGTPLATLGTIVAALTADETAGLHEAARSLRVGIRDLLVWAVARALADPADSAECTIATTGHGREDLFEDVDVSRTVGWFQVLYPIRLLLTDRSSDASSVAEVAAQLGRVPRNGIGYGLLRYAGGPEAERLRAIAPPRIAVNYMGTFGFEEVSHGEELLSVCDRPYGPTEDGSCAWPFQLDVTGSIAAGQLRIELGFGTAAYRRERVDALLEEIRTRLLALVEQHAGPDLVSELRRERT